MKRITVKNKNNVVTHSIELENHIDWVTEAESKKHFGIPERIVDDIDGTYDPDDVIENIDELVSPAVEEVVDENGVVTIPASPAVFKKMVKLKAEYTIEIIDITAEHDLQECIKNRKSEYPTMEEFLNAYFDGGEVAVQALQQKRLLIKQKYKKP